MNRKYIIVMFALTAGVYACRQNSSPDRQTASPTRQFEKPVSKFTGLQLASVRDTSCGMPLSAGLEDTVQLSGKVYGFCSKECKDDFVKTLQKEHKR